jgi:putative hydrolase of the HAD superfamily
VARRDRGLGARTFEGVLLDLYGTLIPAGPRASRAPHLHAMARRLGADPIRFESAWVAKTPDRMVGRLGSLESTIRAIALEQGVEPTSEAVESAVEIRLAFSRETLERCEPTLPDLAALRAAGLRLAVVSDTSAETPQLWPASRLGSCVDTAVFSCDVGVCKPDPRMYRLALERIGLPPERCAFVGDGGSRELTGATAVGLRAFLFRYPEAAPGPDARYDPDLAWGEPPLGALRQLLPSGG